MLYAEMGSKPLEASAHLLAADSLTRNSHLAEVANHAGQALGFFSQRRRHLVCQSGNRLRAIDRLTAPHSKAWRGGCALWHGVPGRDQVCARYPYSAAM
jgi:hypothetical protein